MAHDCRIGSRVRAAGALLLLALGGAACAPVSDWSPPLRQRAAASRDPASTAMREAVVGLEREVSDQIRRCYRSPRVASTGRQIVTTLRARYGPDGSLIGLPVVLEQSGLTPTNRIYAGRMAEAASLAVMRCVPIRMPNETGKGGFTIVDLTFSPVGRA